MCIWPACQLNTASKDRRTADVPVRGEGELKTLPPPMSRSLRFFPREKDRRPEDSADGSRKDLAVVLAVRAVFARTATAIPTPQPTGPWKKQYRMKKSE